MEIAPPDIEVIYEDNHLLAVNKPPGLLTQPARGSGDSLEERAGHWIKVSRCKPGRVFVHAVHRLDKVASGIALFALTDKALSRMNEQMRGHHITRMYHALITGRLPREEGNIMNFLRHSRMKSLVVSEDDQGAKRSVLEYRTLEHSGRLTLVEVFLETGRYHQIRAQLSAAGCPILGDALYGSHEQYAGDGIALHHRRMEFIHPVSKIPVVLEARYPSSWPLA
jgi:23S rRNA pseudouridine1911/1915/1917 synthase